MARTQAADYDQRRAAIIDQGARLFARTGFLGASVADLAAGCETSKSLIYHYFPSKEDILYEVMASHMERLLTAADAVMADNKEPRARMEALVHALMREYVGAADRHKVLLNELDNLPPEKKVIIVSEQRRLIATMESLVVALDPTLKNRPAEALVETMLIFGMINWTHTWFDADGPVSPDRLADMVLAKLQLPEARAVRRKTPLRQAS